MKLAAESLRITCRKLSLTVTEAVIYATSKFTPLFGEKGKNGVVMWGCSMNAYSPKCIET
jgi:hypothetical protein